MTAVYAFGEVLWDFLPSGRHAGGAPFNVCAHLAQLGVSASLISAVGQDELGNALLELARDKRVGTEFVRRVPNGLPTGSVLVSLDEDSNAVYEIVRPAAWDEIRVTPAARTAVEHSGAFIYGSLAGRSPYNLEQLEQLLALEGPLKLFDVNLRPPFTDPKLVIALARRAQVLKLNDAELGMLTAWIAGSATIGSAPRTEAALAKACAALAEGTGVDKICVTRGALGAAFWEAGSLCVVPAPPTRVRDTVGAGDAFMAGLTCGLMHQGAPERILEAACQLGSFVASEHGATPALPDRVRQGLRG